MRGPTSPAIPPYYPVPEFDWRLKQPQRPPAPFFPPQARKEPKGVDEPDYLPVRRRRFPRRTRNARTTAVYNPEQLSRYNLPLIETADDLAARLGTSPGALTWLTWPEDAPSHYVSREIPKRSGGSRLICAPKPRTRAAQDWIMRHILRRLPVHDCAHGFVRGRSILTNAQAHVGKHIVVNLDLEDFFPSISFATVDGLFEWMGYSKDVAWHLAMLCTCRYGGRRYRRSLPQGAPTSPAIANAICWKLDRRLSALAAKSGFTYTRYADDLTLSGDGAFASGLAGTLVLIGKIIAEEGFRINGAKTRFMRRGERQEVTGLVVNDQAGLPRKELRNLRATLHNCLRRGPHAENREHDPLFRERLSGKIALVRMINPALGQKLLQTFDAIDWPH